MSFGDNLKKVRERKEISQAQLANAVGISQPTIAQYEKGMKIPTVATAVYIARRLGTTCEALVEGEECRTGRRTALCSRPAYTAGLSGTSVSLTGMNTTYVRDAEKMYAAAKISIKIDERGCFYGNSNVDESR